MGGTAPLRPGDFDAVRDRTVTKLQALVRIPTVSHVDPERRGEAPFVAFVEELARQFPLLHEHLELTPIPGTPCCSAGRASAPSGRWC